jgi:hypothetical protein
MKNSIRSLVAASAICLAVAPMTRAEDAGFVDFGKLNPSGEDTFVEVNIKSNLIAMVASLAKKAEPEVAQVIEGLKQIRVNVLGLTKENQGDMKKRITTIRETLDKSGWERIVTAIEKGQDVGVFLKTKDAKTVEGICVTVIDKDQVVLVNVVGDIQPEKLSVVGERFDVEPLKHIPARPAKARKTTDADKEATKS